MNTEIKRNAERTIITFSGRMDTPATPEAEAAVLPLMEDASVNDILIDCSQLTYISSSGLRIFITLQKHILKTGGKLTLSGLTPPVQAVFDMTGFSNIFHIE